MHRDIDSGRFSQQVHHTRRLVAPLAKLLLIEAQSEVRCIRLAIFSEWIVYSWLLVRGESSATVYLRPGDLHRRAL